MNIKFNTIITFKSLLGLILVLIFQISAGDKRVTTNEGNVIPAPTREELIRSNEFIKIPRGLNIPSEWEKFLNPAYEDFWNEGNFKPDAGFMLWARNPTKENAKRYLIRMNIKRNVIFKMQQQQEEVNRELIKQGIISDDYDFLKSQKSPIQTIQSLHPSKLTKDVHLYFFFHPDCHHCKKQAENLKGSQNVIPLQVGGTVILNHDGLPKSGWAQKDDLKRYVPKGRVPVLLLFDHKQKKTLSVEGVYTIDEINVIAKKMKD